MKVYTFCHFNVLSFRYKLPTLDLLYLYSGFSRRISQFVTLPSYAVCTSLSVSPVVVFICAPIWQWAMKLQRTRHDMESVVIADDMRLPAFQGPTKVNVVKALWVLQGHEWVLRGKKVNSFLDNILNWATSQAVTVDSHAIQCWFGRMESGTYAVPVSYYAIIEADYRKVAAMVGLTPLQFQAVVWIAKKRLSPSRKRKVAKNG